MAISDTGTSLLVASQGVLLCTVPRFLEEVEFMGCCDVAPPPRHGGFEIVVCTVEILLHEF